jgi:hypothetical protein
MTSHAGEAGRPVGNDEAVGALPAVRVHGVRSGVSAPVRKGLGAQGGVVEPGCAAAQHGLAASWL